MSNVPILSAHHLFKTFTLGGDSLAVLKGASLDLLAGKTVALMGASGTGKSTLLHLLGLLDSPDQGTILLHGKEVQNLSQSASSKLRAEKVGLVFQQFQLLPELSAFENVLMPRRLARGSWWNRRKQEQERAKEALESVGLSNRAKHRPTQLSGGEQQRVAIARALISQPALLLADEPTGNLDARTGDEVLQLLLQLAREQGAACLLATHSAAVAAQCDSTFILRNGELHPAP